MTHRPDHGPRRYRFDYLDPDRISAADQASLSQLYRLYFAELGLDFDPARDPDLSSFRTSASTRSAFLLLRCDDVGAMVGAVGIRDASDPSDPRLGAHCCELRSLSVHPDHRGCGHGGKLVEMILSRARQLGFRRCVLSTKRCLAAAIHIYATLGFTRCEGYSSANQSCDLFFALDMAAAVLDSSDVLDEIDREEFATDRDGRDVV